MTRTYRVGYGGTRLTLEQMEKTWDWSVLHPEFRRRLIALFDAHPTGNLGIGGGGRSSNEQLQLFLSRYKPINYATYLITSSKKRVNWANHAKWGQSSRYWKLVVGASAAPPEVSYHEPTTDEGEALAADLVGWEDGWAKDNCAEYGLREFSDVNGEEWHHQPREIPTSRSNYNDQALTHWPLPGQPTTEVPPMATLKTQPRLVDTREAPWTIVKAGTAFTLIVPDSKPDWAGAAIVNIGVTGTTGPGYVTAWDGFGSPPAKKATVNFDGANQTRSNTAHVPLNGKVFKIFVSTDCHLVVDLQGWDSLIA